MENDYVRHENVCKNAFFSLLHTEVFFMIHKLKYKIFCTNVSIQVENFIQKGVRYFAIFSSVKS